MFIGMFVQIYNFSVNALSFFFQRSKLQLPLIDKDYQIPSQYPYTVKAHRLHLTHLFTENPQFYATCISDFKKKRLALGETWMEPEDSLQQKPSTIHDVTRGSANLQSSRSTESQIHTHRPDLLRNNQNIVKLITLPDDHNFSDKKIFRLSTKQVKKA